MFHLAYLVGGLNAWTNILGRPLFGAAKAAGDPGASINEKDALAAKEVDDAFWRLFYAHIVVPVCTLLAHLSRERGHHLLEKGLNTVSIFYY